MPRIPHIPGLNHITRFAGILSKSFGFSRTINPRNLEYFWYPLWCRILVDLVADTPNLLVFPQYPVWIIAENVTEPESNGDGDDLEPPSAERMQDDKMTRAQARKEAYKKQKEGEARKAKEAKEALAAGRKARAEKRSDIREQAMERGDDGKGKAQPTAPSPPIASTFSDAADREVRISSLEEASTKTIPTPYANGRIVDFAVVNVKAGAHVERPDRYDGWRILEDHVPLLVEIKRSPPRDAQGAQFQISLRYALHEARVAVMLQAAYLFASRPHLAMVMVIAAAGPYWSTAVVLREHEFTDDELNKMLHDTEYVPEEEFVGKPSWSQPVKLYTPESNDTLKEIRTEVMSFHVMTAPEWP